MSSPSTAITSSGCTRRPSTATSPFTVTRPAAISSSHSRRLPWPRAAMTFCSRSPSAVVSGRLLLPQGRLEVARRPTARATITGGGRAIAPACHDAAARRHQASGNGVGATASSSAAEPGSGSGSGSGCASGSVTSAGAAAGAAAAGRLGTGHAQAVLEGLDHVGAGHELGQGRQVGQRVEAEPLQEQLGRTPQQRLARAGVAADLVDVAARLQGAQHAVGIDAPDGGDLGPGDRLLVGHDGQRLQRRGRQARRLALEHEALHVGGEVGVALVAPAAGDPHELEAGAGLVVGVGQAAAQLLDRAARARPSSWASTSEPTGSDDTITMASMARMTSGFKVASPAASAGCEISSAAGSA